MLDSIGNLTLSVDKDLYQELGLSGQPELRLSRQPAKFGNLQYKKLLFLFCIMSISNVFVTTVVTIPLLAKNFTVESKGFKRVFWCLKNHHLELQFSWIMMWKPHSEETCPSSLAAYLDLQGFSVTQCRSQFEQHQLQNSLVPKLPVLDGDKQDHNSVELSDLVEWSAATALNIQWYNEA